MANRPHSGLIIPQEPRRNGFNHGNGVSTGSTVLFPNVRLAVAGYGTLILLAWIGFMPHSMPLYSQSRGLLDIVGDFGTVVLSLCTQVILVPVLWRGKWRDRWLAILLSVFPMLLMGCFALPLLGWNPGTVRI